MKNWLTVLLLTLGPLAASAGQPLNMMAAAERLKTWIEEGALNLPGANGIGISGCHPKTGALDVIHDFVYCVVVYAETPAAAARLRGTYPVGTKIKNVFIAIETLGVVEPRPRMSGGN